jgi:hypothetical protein
LDEAIGGVHAGKVVAAELPSREEMRFDGLKKNGGAKAPPFSFAEVLPVSAQELQNALL